MSYPQAPWRLQGFALQTLHLLDIDRVRPLIPPEFEIVSTLPGKTVGCVYISSYGSGSRLEYNELIVTPAIVSYGGQWGGWVSHIYVDNPDSVDGGREIWGLPKELAEFSWELGNRVTVRSNDQQLCSLNYTSQSFGLAMPTLPTPFLSGYVFSTLGTSILRFQAQFKAKAKLVSGQLSVPPVESPFGTLGLGQPWLTVSFEDLDLMAGTPVVVGQKTVEYSYRRAF